MSDVYPAATTAYADGHVAEDVEDDIDFGGLHTSVPLAKGHVVSALYLINANHGFNDAGGEHLRHTAGLFAKGSAGGFGYQAEGYYQFGRIMETQIAAYMGAARVGYQLDAPGKPLGLLWGEYLSGDGTPEGVFDTLYATNHKFYGEMDFFLAIPANTAQLGLVDVGGRLGASATDEVALHADFHHLRSAEATPAGARVFGNEVDFKVQWTAMDEVAVRALYGIFLPGDAIRAPNGIDEAADLEPEHLGYLTLDVRL
ncbi:MAG: alginate export family protein [Myxococcota bacterium]